MGARVPQNTVLTKKQKEVLEALLNNPLLTDRAVAEMCNISPYQLCQLKKNSTFKEEYQKGLDLRWRYARAKAQEQMTRLAEEGDFSACKYILDSNGLAASQKIEASVENKVINVSIDD